MAKVKCDYMRNLASEIVKRVPMKYIAYLILLLLTAGCAMFRHVPIPYVEVREEYEKLTDSLISNGVDTMISYYQGPACCIGRQEAYVFWVNDGVSAVAKITRSVKVRKNEWLYYVTRKVEYFRWIDYAPPYDYIQKLLDKITTEQKVFDSIKFRFRPDYQFEKIQIVIGKKNLIYSVADYEKRGNETMCSVIFIDKFRSFLLGL